MKVYDIKIDAMALAVTMKKLLSIVISILVEKLIDKALTDKLKERKDGSK